MTHYNLGSLDYSSAAIKAIEEVLSKYYTKDKIIDFINNEEFTLYENCYTLEDVARCMKLQYGDNSATAEEIDRNDIWIDTKFGILIMPS